MTNRVLMAAESVWWMIRDAAAWPIEAADTPEGKLAVRLTVAAAALVLSLTVPGLWWLPLLALAWVAWS